MSPENTNQADKEVKEVSPETLDEFPINVGDMLWVVKNVRDENGQPTLDENGKIVKELQDNWEVVETDFYDTGDNTTKVLLKNPNPTVNDEFKLVNPWRLREIQQEAEDEIIASAARKVMRFDVEAIEKELDDTSGAIESEAVEAGAERLTVEEAEKIGEPPVELAGIEDPDIEQKKSIFESVSIDLRLAAAEDMTSAASDLDKMKDTLKYGERNIFDAIADGVSRLEAVLSRAGDYPTSAIRAEIQQTISALSGPLRAGLYIGHETLNDIDKRVEATRKKLDEHSKIANVKDEAFIDAVGVKAAEGVALNQPLIDKAKEALSEIDEIGVHLKDVELVTNVVINPPNLRAHLNQLNGMLSDSYSAPIDLSELGRVVEKIKDLSTREEARDTYQRAQASVDTLREQLKTAAAILDPRTQAEQ